MTYFQVPVTQMPIAEIYSSQSSYPAKTHAEKPGKSG